MEVWVQITTIVAGLLTGGFLGNVVTLKNQQKKAATEVQKSTLDNVEQSVGFYMKQFDYLTAQITALQTEVAQLKAQLRYCQNCFSNKKNE